MLTHQLTSRELSMLIRDNMYQDLDIQEVDDYCAITSDDSTLYARVMVFNSDTVMLDKNTHDSIIRNSIPLDYTPLLFAGTTEGVYAFNLDLMRLDFEPYSDPEAGIDTMVVQLPLEAGTRVLEWYPDFASEDDYIDALMSAGDGF